MPNNKFVRDVYNIDPSMPFVEDADGNLIGRPSVTCIGVFPYMLEDGTILMSYASLKRCFLGKLWTHLE